MRKKTRVTIRFSFLFRARVYDYKMSQLLTFRGLCDCSFVFGIFMLSADSTNSS